MGTGSVYSANPTLRKFFEKDKLTLSLVNSLSSTLTEGQGVYLTGNRTIGKRTTGAQFPIGIVVTGAAQNDYAAIAVAGHSTMQAKAIGSTLNAGAFVKPNGNKDDDGIIEVVAAVEGDFSDAIVLSGGAANAAIEILYLDSPIVVPGS